MIRNSGVPLFLWTIKPWQHHTRLIGSCPESLGSTEQKKKLLQFCGLAGRRCFYSCSSFQRLWSRDPRGPDIHTVTHPGTFESLFTLTSFGCFQHERREVEALSVFLPLLKGRLGRLWIFYSARCLGTSSSWIGFDCLLFPDVWFKIGFSPVDWALSGHVFA